MRDVIALSVVLALGGCSADDIPRIAARDVLVPVAARCIPDNLPMPPDYPDTQRMLIAAQDAAARYRLLIAGRDMRDARLAELEAALAACRR